MLKEKERTELSDDDLNLVTGGKNYREDTGSREEIGENADQPSQQPNDQNTGFIY